MEKLNLEKVLRKTRERRKLNKARLEKTQKTIETQKTLDYKLTALELLLESLLDGTPGLTQQLESALKNLEELNKKGGW